MKLIVSLVLGSASVAGLAEKDGPAAEKRTPLVKVSQAVPFGDNKGNEKREKLATDIADQVRRDSRANYRISGLFESYEKQDAATLKSVKGDKNMLALIQKSSRVEPAKAAPVKKQAPLDQVQAQIDAQRALVVDIHTPFAEKEKQDIREFQRVRKNPNLQALLQLKKNSWDDLGTTADENIYGSSSSSASAAASSEGAFGTKSFDWRKLSDEIAESAKENGLSDSVASAKENADEDVSSSSISSGADSSTETTATSNMDEMNRYIAKFGAENPADVPKKMNPSDFTQDFHHSSNYGGSVISIPLSSQLQVSTSFLQQKSATKIAPGVEDEVAKEKKWDVYLADGFRAQEVRDEEEVKRMKGRKEYGE